MGIKDIIFTPFYFFLFLIVAYYIRNRYYSSSSIKKYFIPAFLVKMLGALAAGLIYQFYYGGGDTFAYYKGAKVLWETFLNSPLLAIKVFLSSVDIHNYEVYRIFQRFWWNSPSADVVTVIKIAGFFGLFSFNTYSVIALFFSALSFWGNWRLYEVFTELYPNLQKKFAYFILFFPSVVFWGSGLFKDTLAFSAICLLTVSLYQIFIKREKVISNIILLMVFSFILFNIRSFVFYIFIPSFMVWIAMHHNKKVKNKIFRAILTPLVLSISVLFSYLIIDSMQAELKKYSFENLEDTIKGFHTWHVTASKAAGGGFYTLGTISYDPKSMLLKMPEAINVTLFRPYLWEAHNAVALFSALESLLLLGLTVWVIFRSNVKVFSVISKNPIIAFSLCFSLIFAFIVGFTSYNFGALVRYKIPCIPFYLASMVIILNYKKSA